MDFKELLQELGFSPSDQDSGFGKNSYMIVQKGEKIIVSLRYRLRAIRDVRAALLEIALSLQAEKKAKAILVLMETSVSKERLQGDWEEVLAVFQKSLKGRLALLAYPKGDAFSIRTQTKSRWIDDFLLKSMRLHDRKFPDLTNKMVSKQYRPGSFFVILKLLVHRWLLDMGPITTELLGRQAGYSYPTVAKALTRLGDFVYRHSDRRIELSQFPKNEWEELLIRAGEVRHTLRFSDRSGKPRSPASLLRRLYRLQPRNVAIGGVFGARFWDPDLDLQGEPRLDLSLYRSSHAADLALVKRLDPALVEVKDLLEPCSLVLHQVFRLAPLFRKTLCFLYRGQILWNVYWIYMNCGL